MRRLVLLGLAAALLAGCGGSSATLYDVKATQACLKKRPEYVQRPQATLKRLQMYVRGPNRVEGYPDSWHLVAFFVRRPRARFSKSTNGFSATLTYMDYGVANMYFFATEAGARRYHAPASRVPARQLAVLFHVLPRSRNVVTTWFGLERFEEERLIRIVVDCLRS